MTTIDPKTFDLQAQFQRCVAWNDPEQWDALAMLYYERGYSLNALHCFKRANVCREALVVRTDLGVSGADIELTLLPVVVETEA